MAASVTVAVRRAILTHLKADAAVTALVPAASIYPPRRPKESGWPFVAFDHINRAPFRASCLNGATMRCQLTAFAKGDGEAAANISGAIVDSLDGAVLQLEGGGTAHVRFLEDNVLQDGDEASAWRAPARFEATVVS